MAMIMNDIARQASATRKHPSLASVSLVHPSTHPPIHPFSQAFIHGTRRHKQLQPYGYTFTCLLVDASTYHMFYTMLPCVAHRDIWTYGHERVQTSRHPDIRLALQRLSQKLAGWAGGRAGERAGKQAGEINIIILMLIMSIFITSSNKHSKMYTNHDSKNDE